ncbi:schlafen-like protein 1 [Gigantopelta aegis]|uniref:schlafen-like protein 1 n=1 Tax=Gigantopelta aegis TaxID=1735272 RepID=UPI001B88CE14|nr:schlafen-like protein 1 [Gigantopelta aegis]
MSSQFPENTSIYIGGLKSSIGHDKMNRHLIHMFTQIGLIVKKSLISIVDKNTNYVFAFVNLEDEEAVRLALHHLQTPKHRSGVPFDFSLITEQSKVLKFDHRKCVKKTKAQKEMSDEKFYHLGERLGNETRNAEFKEGGFMVGDKKHVIMNTIGKYVCSFLNSDGGTLFIGVNNHGCVVGVSCDQQHEDRYRLQIDDAIKKVHPLLFPKKYTVDFVQIRYDGDKVLDLKVIKITVDKIVDNTQLYDYNEDVYVRRDASIQCLTAQESQEWTRKRIEKEHLQQKEVQHQLAQVTTEMERLKVQVREDTRLKRLQQELDKLHDENYRLKVVVNSQTRYALKKKQSKSCSIM